MTTLSKEYGEGYKVIGKNCDQCVFGIYHTSDGNCNRICAGKNVSEKEAIAAVVADGDCEMFDEGHKLWASIKEKEEGVYKLISFISSIPADQMYIYNRRLFSKDPVGRCSSFHSNCNRGSGGYCYCRLGCTSCMDLENPNKTADNIRDDFIDALRAAGIPEVNLDRV